MREKKKNFIESKKKKKKVDDRKKERERKKGHRPSESNRCFFIVEAGGCTEDTWVQGGGEGSSTKTRKELALKGAESHLLLSKAGCCPKPARSSHTAGS